MLVSFSMLQFKTKGSMRYLSPLEGRKVEVRLHSLTVRVTSSEGHLLLPVQFHHNYGVLKYMAQPVFRTSST
jgi:hypothetical protein